MKQKLVSFLLAAAVAAGCTGCADIGVISGDGPTTVTVTTAGSDSTGDSGSTGTGHHEENHAGNDRSHNTGGYGGYEDGSGYEDVGSTENGAASIQGNSYAGDAIAEDGTYNSAEDVALYLDTYGHLPCNYITKSEARDLGWTGGSVEEYAPGCAIGGDYFGNREGLLPEGSYHECDIDTLGRDSRGAKRVIWSDDGRIYYTEDHYESFTLLYGEE